LAEFADLERMGMLLPWDQEVCMPPAGAAGHGELRATIGRLAHERFTDEQVGDLLESAQPRDDIEADAVRVARRDFDKASRVPGELVVEIARTATAAPVARLETRQR
jgi:carboxypeptidase Taq